jgi:hypothetical protein
MRQPLLFDGMRMTDAGQMANLTLVTLCDIVLGEEAQDRSDEALIRAVRGLVDGAAALVDDMEVVEYGLRLVIGQELSAACEARQLKQSPQVVEGFNRRYERALDVYRRLVGKEPVAH